MTASMNVPYEFCAIRFLELWVRAERPLHQSMMKVPSAIQIRNALKYFRVARNFKGISDKGAEQIAADLLDVSDRCKGSYTSKVMLLASRFKDTFGQSNVSAASKLLWLRNRSPYLIYDARAVKALRGLGNRFDNYISYCEAWETEYERRSDDISRAGYGLVELPWRYTAAFSLTNEQLTELVHSRWFLERVFDIYLWEVGGGENSE